MENQYNSKQYKNRSKLMVFLVIILCGIIVAIWYFMGIPGRNTQKIINTLKNQVSKTTGLNKKAGETRVELFVQGLNVPWSILFTSKERILIAERPGKIREIVNGIVSPEPLVLFNVSNQSEEGLMGLEKDPEYEKNKFLYVCFAYDKGKGKNSVNKVVRLKDGGKILTTDKTLVDNIPSAQYHAGCRVKFGPDGYLYITTGDSTNKNLAQNLDSLAGKILRITKNGEIPSDNPFPNSPIYSYGHRNPQGIDWDESGSLYSTEHGPSVIDGPAGGDEVNLINKGSNYGWPLVSHEKTKEGTVSPIAVYTPAVAPASALVYKGGALPEFTGKLLFGGLKGEGVYVVTLSGAEPSKVEKTEKLGFIEFGRIRDVVQGPDGFIYFSTSNTDGRGKPIPGDDKIYVIKNLP